MPNIITHKIFAEEVLKRLHKKDISDIIERNLQLYYIGSSGPDILFFHHAKPWEAYKDHGPSGIGHLLHQGSVNDFYECALTCIKKEKSASVKEHMSAYLFGHLCHWALDQAAHPYIFYRTGDCSKISAGYHHRFESMLDTLMLERYHQVDIKAYPFYEICEYDEEMLKAIARIYVPSVRQALQKELRVYDLRVVLDEWGQIQRLLYDPNNRKKPFIQAFEKVIKKPWLLSGNIVMRKADEKYDVLNLKHKAWCHPCDANSISTASFLDLFTQALDTAVEAVLQAYGCIEYGASSSHLCHILQDRAYDTGMSGEAKMYHFSIIYEEEENEAV